MPPKRPLTPLKKPCFKIRKGPVFEPAASSLVVPEELVEAEIKAREVSHVDQCIGLKALTSGFGGFFG